jgi:ABC-type multidrug transport system fused ATPase/permease subunit
MSTDLKGPSGARPADRLRQYFRVDLFRFVRPYLWPHRVSMLVVTLMVAAQSGLVLFDPWPMKIIIDNGLSGRPFSAWMLGYFPFLAQASGRAVVVYAILAGLALMLLGQILEVTQSYLKMRTNRTMGLTFKSRMFSHLQRLSFKYHDRTSVGDTMYRLSNDTKWISPLVWGNFRNIVTASATLVTMLWILFRLDWQIALLSLAAAPVYYPTIAWSSRYFKKQYKRQRQMESDCDTIVQEVFSCLRVVKAFGQEAREQKRFEDQSWKAQRAEWRLELQQTLLETGLGWITRINARVILVLGAFHVIDGRLTIGELTVILSYISGVHGPLEQLGAAMSKMQTTLVSAERAMDVLETPIDVQERPGAVALGRVEGAVAFEDVDFAYTKDEPVLRRTSFTAQPGQVIAVVGPTGAGKTTLASLIVRFYDPTSGRVTLDGHDLRDLTLQTLRANIALVLQEPMLFTGRVRDNIAYARPDASPDEIEAAARAANAHDFIAALPGGYDTDVGERGLRLSGGERQRISIARAFLTNAPVLILDEPTSSVDSRTEGVILDALDRLVVGRTTFVIAHRLSTVRHSDQILVLDKGRIVERGTHDQLLAHDGLYAQLYTIQTSGLRRRRRSGVAI